MTIMPTQLESTSNLGNHKLQDCDRNEGDDQDASGSPYKPSPETTMGHNSHTQTNCDALLCGASPTPPQPTSLPPSYPESPLSEETPLWPTSSTAENSWKDNTTVPKESTSPANTSVNGIDPPSFRPSSEFDGIHNSPLSPQVAITPTPARPHGTPLYQSPLMTILLPFATSSSLRPPPPTTPSDPPPDMSPPPT